MTKYEWEKELRRNLKRLPEAEIARVMDYYNELFEDKAEEGLSEREIIKRFGNPFDVAYKILYDSGATALEGTQIRPPEPFVAYESDQKPSLHPSSVCDEQPSAKPARKGSGVMRIVFLVPFIVCAVVLWALVVAFSAGAFGAITGGVLAALSAFLYIGSSVMAAVIGAGFVAIGIGIVMAIGATFLIKTAVRLTQKYFYMTKHKAEARSKECAK